MASVKTSRDVTGPTIVVLILVVVLGSAAVTSGTGVSRLLGAISGSKRAHEIQILVGYGMFSPWIKDEGENNFLIDATVDNVARPLTRVPRTPDGSEAAQWMMWVNATPLVAHDGQSVAVEIKSQIDGPLRCAIRQDGQTVVALPKKNVRVRDNTLACVWVVRSL
jgi:hypothetical protein